MAVVNLRNVPVNPEWLSLALLDAGYGHAGWNFHALFERLTEVGNQAARAAVLAEYQRLIHAGPAEFAALGLVPDAESAEPIALPLAA